jgi:hypothetical protein
MVPVGQVDIEQKVGANQSGIRDGITLLMLELAEQLRPRIEGGGQLSFDVASQVRLAIGEKVIILWAALLYIIITGECVE